MSAMGVVMRRAVRLRTVQIYQQGHVLPTQETLAAVAHGTPHATAAFLQT